MCWTWEYSHSIFNSKGTHPLFSSYDSFRPKPWKIVLFVFCAVNLVKGFSKKGNKRVSTQITYIENICTKVILTSLKFLLRYLITFWKKKTDNSHVFSWFLQIASQLRANRNIYVLFHPPKKCLKRKTWRKGGREACLDNTVWARTIYRALDICLKGGWQYTLIPWMCDLGHIIPRLLKMSLRVCHSQGKRKDSEVVGVDFDFLISLLVGHLWESKQLLRVATGFWV